jgi:hypothetical protein
VPHHDGAEERIDAVGPLRNDHHRTMARDRETTAPDRQPASAEPDFFIENGLLVYTATYHLKRGFCCGSGCRHCPYEPRHVEGSTKTE